MNDQQQPHEGVADKADARPDASAPAAPAPEQAPAPAPPEPDQAPDPDAKWRRWDGVGAALVALGVLGSAAFAVTDHPHRAVLLIVAMCFAMAVQRALWPVRTWFASRNRWADVAVLVAAGALLWYFSPFTATMPPG